MKTYALFLAVSGWLLVSVAALGQNAKELQGLPDVKVKDLQGRWVSAQQFSNDGKPLVISFWATWCKPCLVELETLKEVYPDWQEETGVKIIAVSIDDARNSRKVAPFVKSRGWKYEVYLDENSELRRALGVTNIPHTFLLDGDGKIVWQHASFTPGDEEELYEHILALIRRGTVPGQQDTTAKHLEDAPQEGSGQFQRGGLPEGRYVPQEQQRGGQQGGATRDLRRTGEYTTQRSMGTNR